MAGLARVGDKLACGDTIISGSSDVFIEGIAAATADSSTIVTSGHGCGGSNSHSGTALYPDQASIGTRPAITINGKTAGLEDDWNAPGTPTNRQIAPNYPDPHGSSANCPVKCGSQCHDSQIITTTTQTTAG